MDFDQAEPQAVARDLHLATAVLLPAMDGRACTSDPPESDVLDLDVTVPTSLDGDIAPDSATGALSSTAAADQGAQRLEAVILTIIFAAAVVEVIAVGALLW